LLHFVKTVFLIGGRGVISNGKLLLKKRSHFNRAIVILLVYFSVCLQI